MHNQIARIFPGMAAAALVLAACGCWGPRRHDVTGHVKVKGAILDKPNGKIVFVGPKDVQVAASINADGSYRAVGVVAGMNRVAVYYPNPDFQPPKRHRVKPKEGEPASEPAASSSPFLTPRKYASPDTSGLSVEVKEGKVFDVDLTEEPNTDALLERPWRSAPGAALDLLRGLARLLDLLKELPPVAAGRPGVASGKLAQGRHDGPVIR